jgi:hypothetical protein
MLRRKLQAAGPLRHMTSQGTAHGGFTRAIQQSNLYVAEIAAREMRGLSLHDALDLVALIAREKPERLERTAIRWHGRLELEAHVLTIAESQFAHSALMRLTADPQTIEPLRRLLRQAGPTTVRPIR